MTATRQFIYGINYWPINKAMYWWRNYDYQEVEKDFTRLSGNGFKVIRIFLTWEDFQPHPDYVSTSALNNLKRTADLAASFNIQLMPTFFCGHMSGVNWMPYWMLNNKQQPGNNRFPVYSQGSLKNASIHNFYTPEIIQIQLLQIREVCSALRGHEAIFAYDLGNETSNCSIPGSREDAHMWLQAMTSCIRQNSNNSPVTLGMHAEDLEEDRNLWPEDAALFCDFLSMHGYPFYLSWVDDNLDPYILPFLGIITEWLGKKPVLFQEFGAPSIPIIPPLPEDSYINDLKCPLWKEEEVLTYYQKALQLLNKYNMTGAFAWCFADYAPELWTKAPLNLNPHERHFGLFRHDGTEKAAVEAFNQQFVEDLGLTTSNLYSWLDEFDRNSFYKNPKNNLRKMFDRYKQSVRDNFKF